MTDDGCFHPSSFILHPSSFILHPSSFIPHPSEERRTTMETEKKQWTKPELIVLVRSKPEEAVLSACKGGYSGTPAGDDGHCYLM
jgi:hypothetical protein